MAAGDHFANTREYHLILRILQIADASQKTC